MSKYMITATIVFEVEADDPAEAAQFAWGDIEDRMHCPENIMVWDGDPTHWFASRYTYTNPPIYMSPNQQRRQTIMPPPKVTEEPVNSELSIGRPA